MLDKPCPFCEIAADKNHSRIISQNQQAFVIRDGFPVSNGHTLIIPKKHVGSFFDLSEEEKWAMLSLLELSKNELDKSLNPQGYNIGINDGTAAGQTVPHCHTHLIPRYDEPGKEPRGGVRWVVPEKADYWSALNAS
jgi:diadenosine tetraphosphate (Ap4A) HIT family hydrolase